MNNFFRFLIHGQMIPSSDKVVHVFNQNSSKVWNVLHDVIDSYLQEEPFFVFDIGDIVNKFKMWKKLFPRVEPFYGKYDFFGHITLFLLYL